MMASEPMSIDSETQQDANELLDDIENEHDITIVYAAAHGSHATGLANESSDFDIRGIGVPDDLLDYVLLNGQREVITTERGEFDIEIWDVKKFGELLTNTNDGAIDLVRSPIVYRNYITDTVDDLHETITTDFNPIQLYHIYRSIAENNYRKYLSRHLTSNRNNVYPILDIENGEYIVRNPHANTVYAIDADAVDGDEHVGLPADELDLSDTNTTIISAQDESSDDDLTLPTTFQETATKQTVKRNLAVLSASLHARYLLHSGRDGKHELPNIDIETFLHEQVEPTIGDTDLYDDSHVQLAFDLIKRKRGDDDSDIGDQVGRDFAHPPIEIDPTVHNTGSITQETANQYIESIVNAARNGDT